MEVNVSLTKSFERLQRFRVVPQHGEDFLVRFDRFASEVFEYVEFASFCAPRNVGYAVDSLVHEFFFVKGKDVAKRAVRVAALSRDG